jgi:drug/metabolite transporter (DMT)-like permease
LDFKWRTEQLTLNPSLRLESTGVLSERSGQTGRMSYKADSQTRATLVGAVAVLMWSTLAPLTAAAGGIPPLELLATSFGIAFLCGLAGLLIVRGRSAVAQLRQPVKYLAFAVAALFGYHALYFTALTLAPPAQASLVAYLWPLLIVLFATLGERRARISAGHIIGTLLGLTGTALLILSRDGGETAIRTRPLGLLAAFGCALTWSSYSVFNRRFRNVPTDTMVVVCGCVAILGLAAHWFIGEPTALPRSSQWAAMAALGIGPVGLAFFAWDHGTKQGNISLLGTLSYAAPVLSTLLLVTFGRASASISLLMACVLVTAGAWVATRVAPTSID